ncbi:retrovirus-related pol polyprotein from transposon TNT 1-94 [Tanacetum coccineum]
MDVKTAFLNGPLKEEVYVSQPGSFVDPDFQDHVYKLKKALYGLKQSLRAWYDKLSSFLIENHFTKGIVDPTLFTRHHGDDILLVQLVDLALLLPPLYVLVIMHDLRSNTSKRLSGSIDADHVVCHDEYKSTSGGLQFLGEKLVSWSSKKQDCTAMSTMEAEYEFNKIPMYCDSKSAISISCNPFQHSRTKHINIRYHFIKEHVEQGMVELYFVGTKYQLADLFTKALLKETFEYLVHQIGPWRHLEPSSTTILSGSFCFSFLDLHSTILTYVPVAQATDNNNVMFVDAPTFSDVLPFFRNGLKFSLPMRLPTHFVTKGLTQPWQTVGKIFTRCLTTRVTGHDQPPFQIMQMLYYFINNVHVDYVELLLEGLHYLLMHPTRLIPYPRFIKIIVDHFMSENPDIPKRLHKHYHRVANDEIVKSILTLESTRKDRECGFQNGC